MISTVARDGPSLLGLVALAASAWPAWRASHVDPVRALRGE